MDTVTSLGIKSNELFNNVSIYPNPNKGNLNLSINSTANCDYNVSISDALGRMIYMQKQILQLGNKVVPLNV